MRLVSLSDIRKTDFYIGRISSAYRTPTYKILNNKGRTANGFLLVEKGDFLYEWNDEKVRLKPGSLIYLPCGSKHILTITTEEAAFTDIRFTMLDCNGESIIFSTTPFVFEEKVKQHVIDNIHDLTNEFCRFSNALRRLTLLSSILDELTAEYEHTLDARIAPILNYLNEHCNEKINCDELSKLCYLSKSQMYKIFKKKIGCSPIEYRNRLLLEKACELLCTKEYSVQEVANVLGFENAYYFSRLFKKHFNIPPSKY